MKVSQRYSYVSETLLYEEFLNETRMQVYYPYWLSIKDIDVSQLNHGDYMRLEKIKDLHMRLKRKRR